MSELDAAALHPALREKGLGRHYFAESAAVRADLAGELVQHLRAENFVPYLVNNTTSGVLATLLAAAMAGRSVGALGAADQHYPAYADILPHTPTPDWQFRTHVSPLTGVTDPLDGETVQVVDAAQSLGTTLTGGLLRAADVAIAPLHKHLGLTTGLGLVLVRRDRDELAQVHATLRVAESGAQSLQLLRTAHASVLARAGRVYNVAEVIADEDLAAWCDDQGLRLLARGRGVPFACLTTNDGTAVTERVSAKDGRHFRSHNVVRFSFCRDGSASDAPIDCTDEFRDSVTKALAR